MTDFARLRGLSTSVPLTSAAWYDSSCSGIDVQDRRQFAVVLGQAQDMHAFRLGNLGVRVGEHVQLAAARLDFLEVGLQLVEQRIVGRDGDHRHVAVDQRQRAVLEFAGRVGFGVDVGDFLELQRAFQGDRVMPAAAEEQRVLLVGEALGPGLDLGFELEHLVDRHRQVAQLVEVGAFVSARRGGRLTLAMTSVSRNSAASWVVKALVEATPISGPARVMKRSARFADDGRFGHVADGQRACLPE